MNYDQQPQIIYVQQPAPAPRQSGCSLFVVFAIGLLFLAGWVAFKTATAQENINQVQPAVTDFMTRTSYTPTPDLAPTEEMGLFEYDMRATAEAELTRTAPEPTATAVTLMDYGLPIVAPYTLEQASQCREIANANNLHTLKSPQREICEMYTK